MLPTMLEEDRRRAGWFAAQAAWRLGVSPVTCREPEARRAVAGLRDMGLICRTFGWAQTFVAHEAI
jgi:hypothetical protein